MPIDALIDPKETNIKGFEMPDHSNSPKLSFDPESEIPEDFVKEVTSEVYAPDAYFDIGRKLKVLFPSIELSKPFADFTNNYISNLRDSMKKDLANQNEFDVALDFFRVYSAIFMDPSLAEDILPKHVIDLNSSDQVDKIPGLYFTIYNLMTFDLVNQMLVMGKSKNVLSERIDNWEKTANSDDLINKIKEETSNASSILLEQMVVLSKIRLARPNLYEKIKDSFLTEENFDQAKKDLEEYYNSNVLGRDLEYTIRGYLDYCSALAIISAHKAEVTENGINITMQDPNLPISTTSSPLPEERSF